MISYTFTINSEDILSHMHRVSTKFYGMFPYAIYRIEKKMHKIRKFFYLLWMFKLVYKINFFHQVSSNCSDQVIEIVFCVIFRGQPEWNVIYHSRIFAERLKKQKKKDRLIYNWMRIFKFFKESYTWLIRKCW